MSTGSDRHRLPAEPQEGEDPVEQFAHLFRARLHHAEQTPALGAELFAKVIQYDLGVAVDRPQRRPQHVRHRIREALKFPVRRLEREHPQIERCIQLPDLLVAAPSRSVEPVEHPRIPDQNTSHGDYHGHGDAGRANLNRVEQSRWIGQSGVARRPRSAGQWQPATSAVASCHRDRDWPGYAVDRSAGWRTVCRRRAAKKAIEVLAATATEPSGHGVDVPAHQKCIRATPPWRPLCQSAQAPTTISASRLRADRHRQQRYPIDFEVHHGQWRHAARM